MLNSAQSSGGNLEPFEIQFGNDTPPLKFMKVAGMNNDEAFAALESMAKANGFPDVFDLLQAKQTDVRTALANMPSKLH